MKLKGDRVLLDCGPLEEKHGRVFIPEASQKYPWKGKVVDAGPAANDLKKGDYVLFRMDMRSAMDGDIFSLVHLSSHPNPLILTEQAIIQGKLRKAKKMIDYKKDVIPLGRHIVLDVELPEQETESGLWVPEFKMGAEPLVGTIVRMGSGSLKDFVDKKEIKEGDRVLLSRKMSGGWYPGQEKGKERYWRTMPSMILCVWKEGDWQPIRQGFTARAVWPNIEKISPEEYSKLIKKKSIDSATRYRKKGTNILLPNLPIPRQCVILAKGKGIIPTTPHQEVEMQTHEEVKPGMTCMIPRVISPNGKRKIGEVIQGKEETDMTIIMNTHFIVAITRRGEIIDPTKSENLEMSDAAVQSLIFNS